MKVILAFGGRSRERWVSTATAQSLAKAFEFSSIWFFGPAGEVVEVDKDQLIAFERAYERDFSVKDVKSSAVVSGRVLQTFSSRTQAFESLRDEAKRTGESPVVVMGFHGTDGEDGVIQAELERLGIPFTGSDSKASALGFDKARAKSAVEKAGGRVAQSQVLESLEVLKKFQTEFGSVVVKPLKEGSSFGLHFVHSSADVDRVWTEITTGPELSQQLKPKDYMIEQFIRGRELTLTVLDADGDSMALIPTEIVAEQGRVFDYQGKYLGAGVKEVTPAEVSPVLLLRAQKLALLAHKALGCSGYSRTDMMVDQSGDIYFLETNTLPGLTKASLVPQQLKACGIGVVDFLKSQIAHALKRAR